MNAFVPCVAQGHPERYSCRLCVFKKCLYANVRDNKPCARFEMSQADIDFYNKRDAEDSKRKQNEEDRKKYAFLATTQIVADTSSPTSAILNQKRKRPGYGTDAPGERMRNERHAGDH